MASPFSLEILDSELQIYCARTDRRLVLSRTTEPPLKVSVRAGRSDPGEVVGGRHMDVQAVFGIYWLLSGPYLAMVTEATRECAAPAGGSILRAGNTSLMPFWRQSRVLTAEQRDDEHALLEKIKSVFASHSFFFSLDADVTHTVQRCKTMQPDISAQPLAQRADDRFFWNQTACADLIAAGAWDWVVPMMSAFIEEIPGVRLGSHVFTMVLISRRSCRRQGTRFCRRGIDAEGNVANFVETEQIAIKTDGSLSACVQIRGSIPLVWASPVTLKYAPRVKLADQRANQRPFNLHADDLLARYESVLCVNLIDGKKDQKMLGDAFQVALEAYGNPNLRFDWFDFHKECKKGGWTALNILVSRVDAEFQRQSHFAMDASGAVKRLQCGVMRTNCMDNLDRTNVVQSLFARRSLLLQLGESEALMGDVLESGFPEFERAFKNLWADHADLISTLYAGTGALKTDFTRTGKRTKKGALTDGVNSVTRYYLNNFRDGDRQDSIDLFLGLYVPKVAKYVSPRGTAEGQETRFAALLKLALLFAAIALFAGSSLQELAGPQALPLVYLLVLLVIAHVLVKKGSSYGKRCVAVPRFRPEAMFTVP